ncbi:hypothetical protein, partial [Dapis sp. BLCC M172]|uniref:hypothetical protein n=1 Tax=Dapis sp. BLCC M172 TaxID=2975281 RepID=UPI003CEE1E89
YHTKESLGRVIARWQLNKLTSWEKHIFSRGNLRALTLIYAKDCHGGNDWENHKNSGSPSPSQ